MIQSVTLELNPWVIIVTPPAVTDRVEKTASASAPKIVRQRRTITRNHIRPRKRVCCGRLTSDFGERIRVPAIVFHADFGSEGQPRARPARAVDYFRVSAFRLLT